MPDTATADLVTRSEVEGHVADLAELAEARADELIAWSGALIDEYAINAPEAVRKGALVRLVSWFMEETPGLKSEAVGDIRVMHTASTGGLYHSGAASMLTKWKHRGLGTVG